jgi:hypothetical protein
MEVKKYMIFQKIVDAASEPSLQRDISLICVI